MTLAELIQDIKDDWKYLAGAGLVALIPLIGLAYSNYDDFIRKNRAQSVATERVLEREQKAEQLEEQKRQEDNKKQCRDHEYQKGMQELKQIGEEISRMEKMAQGYNPQENTSSKPKNTAYKPDNTSPNNHVSKDIHRLMSDEFFRNSRYITKDQIKEVLRENNSCLLNKGIENTIISAAEQYQINPAIILARLQTEQGLLTKNKASKNALNYATGYGALDGKTLKSGGLNSQITNTARRMDELCDMFREGEVVKIDGGIRTIKPENGATYAMLRYTPHTHGSRVNSEVLTNYIMPHVWEE